ncbi:hypothetical protein ACN4EG_01160 [Alkalinema pantanalense CENA528]|uniref:hypothetical protein n=1 Tax=Alkalinema pantanalense TaxID=1620705 RepID=UPI003D6F6A1E
MADSPKPSDDQPPNSSIQSAPANGETRGEKVDELLSQHPLNRRLLIVSGVVGGLAAIVTASTQLVESLKDLLSATHDPISQAQLKILMPANNSEVPIQVKFQGTFHSLPDRYSPWLCIYAPAIKRYYYEEIIPPVGPKKGAWQSGPFPIGDQSSKGIGFTIEARLLDPKDSEMIRTFQEAVARRQVENGRKEPCLGTPLDAVNVMRQKN